MTKINNINAQLSKIMEILKSGNPIILYDGKREGEADLILSGQHCGPEGFNALITHGKGLACAALGYDRAQKIGIKRLDQNDRDVYATPFGTPVGSISASTGISALDRANTVLDLCVDNQTINAFAYPGHVHTLIEHKDGLSGRQGHTEAAIALMRIFGFKDCAVLCEILNKKGDIATLDEIQVLAKALGTQILDVEDVIEIESATV